MRLIVDTQARTLTAFGRTIPCAIGRAGACPAESKREGDGMTPLGSWPIRAILLRPDRIGRPSPNLPRPDKGGEPLTLRLPWRWLRPDDGWSDDPADPEYNHPIRHPHRFSAERLWREDGLYDVIVVLGHNDAPPAPGQGSAIFLHIWNDGAPTEGCVAIPREELLALLPPLVTGDGIAIG